MPKTIMKTKKCLCKCHKDKSTILCSECNVSHSDIYPVKSSKKCKHEKQSYIQIYHGKGRLCEEYNLCRSCKAKLQPDIEKAEE